MNELGEELAIDRVNGGCRQSAGRACLDMQWLVLDDKSTDLSSFCVNRACEQEGASALANLGRHFDKRSEPESRRAGRFVLG